MSNLLFDERPLVIQPTLARMLGSLDEAVILQQIHYWLVRSTNVNDGYKWVYNSMTEWHKQFSWLAIATLKRKFKSLEDKGLLITGNYNKAKFDKTKWYRINYDALDEMKQRLYQNDTTRVSNCTNGEYQNDTTNTIDYQENTSDKAVAVEEQEQMDNVSNEADIFGEVQACGIQITPFNQQLLVDYIQKLNPELIVYAAQQTSVSAKHPNFNYFKAILERYIQLGLESVEEAKELEAKFEANKQQRSRSYTKKPTSGKSKWGGQLNEYDVTF